MTHHNSPPKRLLRAAAICLAAICAMGQPARFDPAPWLQDYASLKQALEMRYANLAWFGSPEGGVDLPALDRGTIDALRGARSETEARAALLAFVTAFHDGHFSVLPRLASTPTARPPQVPAPTLLRQNAVDGCAAQGFGVGEDTRFSTPFEGLPGFHLIADGLSQPFRAGTLAADGDRPAVAIVRIPVFRSNHPSMCLQAWTRPEVWSPDGALLRDQLRNAMKQLWYETLAGLLRNFKAGGSKALIVDIGNVSGGNDSGDAVTRLFTGNAVRSSPLWMVQNEAASGAYFEEELQALQSALASAGENKSAVERALAVFRRGKEKLDESNCHMDWVWRERRPWNTQRCRHLVAAGSSGGPLDTLAQGTIANEAATTLHWPAEVQPLWGSWTGPVYVLTNARSYSAAEMFAAVMQNNRAAKIIGRRTGGDGCGFMNDPRPLVLPNSKLRFRVPNCVRIKADGADEVTGVIPDIPVEAVAGERPVHFAARLLSALIADRKAQ